MGFYGDKLEAYLAGRLSGRELAAMDVHLSNTLFWTEWIAEAQLGSAQWERRGWLGRLVRVDAEAVEIPLGSVARDITPA